MTNKTKSRFNIRQIVCLVLSIVMMIVIFYMSSFEGASSSKQSGFVIKTFKYLPRSEFIVRKMGHFLEYFILGISLSGIIFNKQDFCLSKRQLLLKGAITFLIGYIYACSDEIHQLFVKGRACRLFDVGVDSVGLMIGIVIMLSVLKISLMIRDKE